MQFLLVLHFHLYFVYPMRQETEGSIYLQVCIRCSKLDSIRVIKNQEPLLYDHHTHKSKAILFMIISATLFAFMSAFVKLAGDLPSMEKALFRNIVSLVISFSFLKYRKQPLWGERKNRKMLILRGIIGSLGIIFYFYSILRPKVGQ